MPSSRGLSTTYHPDENVLAPIVNVLVPSPPPPQPQNHSLALSTSTSTSTSSITNEGAPLDNTPDVGFLWRQGPLRPNDQPFPSSDCSLLLLEQRTTSLGTPEDQANSITKGPELLLSPQTLDIHAMSIPREGQAGPPVSQSGSHSPSVEEAENEGEGDLNLGCNHTLSWGETPLKCVNQRRRFPRSSSVGSPELRSPGRGHRKEVSPALSPLGPRHHIGSSSIAAECIPQRQSPVATGTISLTSSTGHPSRPQHNRSLSGDPGSPLGLSPLRRHHLRSNSTLSPSPSLSRCSPVMSLHHRTSSGQQQSPPLSSLSPSRNSSLASPNSPLLVGWVDPNELYIDLSKVARHRHRRSFSTSRGDSLDTLGPEGPIVGSRDKKAERAERHERIQKLLKELSAK